MAHCGALDGLQDVQLREWNPASCHANKQRNTGHVATVNFPLLW